MAIRQILIACRCPLYSYISFDVYVILLYSILILFHGLPALRMGWSALRLPLLPFSFSPYFSLQQVSCSFVPALQPMDCCKKEYPPGFAEPEADLSLAILRTTRPISQTIFLLQTHEHGRPQT